jgi:hypothetical protein
VCRRCTLALFEKLGITVSGIIPVGGKFACKVANCIYITCILPNSNREPPPLKAIADLAEIENDDKNSSLLENVVLIPLEEDAYTVHSSQLQAYYGPSQGSPVEVLMNPFASASIPDSIRCQACDKACCTVRVLAQALAAVIGGEADAQAKTSERIYEAARSSTKCCALVTRRYDDLEVRGCSPLCSKYSTSQLRSICSKYIAHHM